MPITKSAKKALRVSKRKRVVNIKRKDAMHDAIKTFEKAIVAKKQSELSGALSSAYRAIDKATKRGVLKKNTASRKKSRLAALLKRA